MGIEMTLAEQVRRFKLSLEMKLKEAALLVEGEMHRIVAIDTGALDESIKTDDVIDRGNVLSVDVGSEGVPYAVFVDQGVRGEVFNYHRRAGASRQVVFTGFGQHWLERSLLAMESTIAAKIREAKIS